MRFLIIMVILTILTCTISGCGQFPPQYYADDAVETCHQGVVYLQFTTGSSVKHNQDGSIARCY